MSDTPRPLESPPPVVVWIVGKDSDPAEFPGQWEIQGAYVTEAAAVARCEGPEWFVGPLTIGQHIASDRQPEWPGCYRPRE